jgi:hypothetical protein
MARRSTRPDIVVDAEGLGALIQLLQLEGGILFGFDLCFALAVGGLGLLEDTDEVLALQRVSDGAYRASVSYRRLTLLTTLPDLLMTVMVSPTPIAAK